MGYEYKSHLGADLQNQTPRKILPAHFLDIDLAHNAFP